MAPLSPLLTVPILNGAISVELPLPILHLNSLPFLDDMAKIRAGDEVSVASVEGERVVLLVVRIGEPTDGVVPWRFHVRSPPDLDAFEFIGDFLVVVEAEDRRLAVLDVVSLEALGVLRGVGAEVGLNGHIDLTPLESVAGVLIEGDVDVREDKPQHFVGVFSEVTPELVREILLEHSISKHQAGHNGAHMSPHFPHADHHLSEVITIFQ
ncbi:hypothetical protein TIFTF001_051518 [Ficus carica]|uniref:Uncharacterized protein n=1 Tax=Ficus carica TaxID=3494 RepID=A0AA88D4C2_FICCA|nr:hypothetical protein TIFTF001_051518 [Ficus carica]